ncbi:DNA-binding transcriptional regulator, AcrR family [Asanoa hainanensis]|uniref:DNA-binding transcriptional regulator, AcrR family n=1 Tax=Asanoa hainanensis TaxID=560556 RepID=A0A239GWX3_9ACTN|nr:TetR/AcrR family transcriptional regulator [Asanoa hainanensis]SNS73392.1 DNA-binding transcriptional regulator, AcrR family [Asanoa hainanensis]
MGRWEPNARGRLEEAALALYGERGYEQVTVAEIAARAGLTERTFFRHYSDKREVLFAGSSLLREVLVKAVAEAPDGAPPVDVVGAALAAAGAVLEERRELARARQAVIDANPSLQEREVVKLATLATAVTEALRDRGIPEPAASLAAQSGIAVFRVAFERWIRETGQRSLPDLVRESFDELRTLTAT